MTNATLCPRCSKPASGLNCQGCGMQLVSTPEKPQMVSSVKVAELTAQLDQKSATIDSLFDQCSSLKKANELLSKHHAELSAEYATLLTEHSSAVAEIAKLTAILNQPPQTAPTNPPNAQPETVAK